MSEAVSDEQLLRRLQLGSDAAFAELVNRHGRYLYGVANAILGDPFDAEDAVQEALLAALSAEYRGEASVRTWLVGITVRQAGMLRRKRLRWRRAAPQPPPAADPIGAVDARIDLAEMLSRLPIDHRQVIVLRELEHMSYEQIAQVLQIPRGTVESRLHRARQQLRTLFGHDQPDRPAGA